MKSTLPPWILALFLLLGCGLCRLLSSQAPDWFPDYSPLLAVSYVGALLLPLRWGWLVGPCTFLLTDRAFGSFNTGSGSPIYSNWTLMAFSFYLLVGGLGAFLQSCKSLGKIVTGCIAGSITFYILGNSYAFFAAIQQSVEPTYPATLAGWWQANTVGLPGWPPTWLFLRNSLIGDLTFTLGLLLVLDRAWLLAQLGRRPLPQLA